jgi:hypothetical protein
MSPPTNPVRFNMVACSWNISNNWRNHTVC